MKFESALSIADAVRFTPMKRQSEKYQITGSSTGMITAVRFTESKVFYDVVDSYYGILFKNVDSNYVTPIGEE